MKTKNKVKAVVVLTAFVLLSALLVGIGVQLRALSSDSLAEFGGETVLYADFDKPSSVKTVTGIHVYLDYGELYQKLGSFTEGNGAFVYTVPANSVNLGYGVDPCMNFDFGDTQISEYSVMTMDFDIDVRSESGAELYFNCDYRDESNTGYSNLDAQLVYVNGRFYLNAGSPKYVGECESNKFHVTYIVNDEKTLIYIDGRFLCEAPRSYNNGATKFTGFRMGMLQATYKSSDFVVALDNLVINKFGVDYNGNIHKLFANPDVLLKKNSDTVFGGSFVWEKE